MKNGFGTSLTSIKYLNQLRKISSSELVCESPETRFNTVLGEGEIGCAVPYIGWNLDNQAKKDE
jgi:hypothetical protein